MAPYARHRAPAESGQKLVAPPWTELPELLAANLAWRERTDFDLLGRPLSEFAAAARAEVMQLAKSLGRSHPVGESLRDSPFQVSERIGNTTAAAAEAPVIAPLIVTGHQPGLVHPGVWIKNFAAGKLAAAHDGAGLHIIIDADLCRSTSTLVPAGNVDTPRFAIVDFDGSATALPWEERRIVDAQAWQSFPQRIAEACAALVPDRYLDLWWPRVLERGEATGLVGASLAQARHLAEADWGCSNLELPQCQLCQTHAFRHFACSVLADLPRFVAAYNGVLADYRRDHHLRNHAQPVPNLAEDGPWLEAPFWIWTAADPRRRPLFVRSSDGGLLVSDKHSLEQMLPLTGAIDARSAIAALADWEAAGVKLRSRALITTMFLRLALADVFLHGIGGAKYDEATDAISERFFGAAPPAFATISGTLRLPIAHDPVRKDEAPRLRTELRELTFHPERRLDFSSLANGKREVAEALVAAKRRWIRTSRLTAGAKRHRGIVAANAGLQEFVLADRAKHELALAAALDRSRSARVLDSREYAFCLFPGKLLELFLLDF